MLHICPTLFILLIDEKMNRYQCQTRYSQLRFFANKKIILKLKKLV